MMSPSSRPRFDYDRDDSFDRSRGMDSDEDEDDDDEEGDPTLGLVLANNPSLISLEAQEREEALQRANQELHRKVAEQDRILQNRISEHEAELERMEILLEETKSELSLAKREEKELRAKEIKYIHQIQALESEIAKSQKALENAKASYQSLQKQYQEQCSTFASLSSLIVLSVTDPGHLQLSPKACETPFVRRMSSIVMPWKRSPSMASRSRSGNSNRNKWSTRCKPLTRNLRWRARRRHNLRNKSRRTCF